MSRPYQFARTGALYLTCPTDGNFSIGVEKIEGAEVDVAVFQAGAPEQFFRIG